MAKKVKKVCTKEVSRAWTKKCEEDAVALDGSVSELLEQLASLRSMKTAFAVGMGIGGGSGAGSGGGYGPEAFEVGRCRLTRC